ncbi:hypothetical protein HDU97_009309 [Phlyctochytrium planicorne]|nr:hypothetical protein HDU97_009309 [Phlyctochytrium planicorne]
MSFRTGRRVQIPANGWNSQINYFLKNLFNAIIIVGVPSFMAYQEYNAKEVAMAMKEANKVASTDVKPQTVSDYDFALSFPRSVKVERRVEYCQWSESFTDEERRYRDGNGDERVETVRSYYYYKGWHTTRIPSIFFDQPAAHHNPQRDPYPASSFIPTSAQFGNFQVPSSILSKASPLRAKKDFTASEIRQGFQTSPAANLRSNAFAYIGNGYFYSAYEPSTTEKVLRMAGTFLEGSILDFQIGDLFSMCNAGDIRVSFETVDIQPGKGATALGKLLDTRGHLGIYETTRGYKLGLFALDASTPGREILRRELISMRWQLLFSRFILFPWALYILYTPRIPRTREGYALWTTRAVGVTIGAITFTGLVLRAISASYVVVVALAAGLYYVGTPEGYGSTRRTVMDWVGKVRRVWLHHSTPSPQAANPAQARTASSADSRKNR